MISAKLILFLCASLFITFWQLKPLVRKKWKKEAWVAGFFYALSIVITSLMIMGIPIPNPLDFIEWVYSPLVKPLLSLLQG